MESDAATIAWNASSSNNGFDTKNGTDLQAGNFVRIGNFNISDSEIQARFQVGDLQYLDLHFTEAATTTIGTGVGNNDGHFTKNTPSYNNAIALAGKQVYIWVLNSTNNSNISTSINTAFEVGIFYEPLASNSSWAFPADAAAGSTAVSTGQLANAAGNAALPEAKFIVGQFGPGTTALSGKTAFTLAAVPEPGSIGLALLGGVALLARRRRMS